MTASRSEIQHAHNLERKQNGMHVLTRDSGLDASAQIVAHRLARRDKGIEHAQYWWRVIDKMTKKRYGAEGENLADGFNSIGLLIAAWMASVLHRKNILSKKFSKIGIGIAVARSGTPYYVVHFGGK